MCRSVFWTTMILALGLFSGCAMTRSTNDGAGPLRVGTAPDYPPITFKQGGQLLGLEADNARRVADALHRELEMHALPFDELIPALTDNKIDVIMSGMTSTEARRREIAFSDPFLTVGLDVLMREEGIDKYSDDLSVKQAEVKIGAQKGTTGAVYVDTYCFGKKEFVPVDPLDAPSMLKNGKIDIYIHDTPVIRWLAPGIAPELMPMDINLMSQNLCWGVRRSDGSLRKALNRLVADWRKSGRMERSLGRWVPDTVTGSETSAVLGVVAVHLDVRDDAAEGQAEILVGDEVKQTVPLTQGTWRCIYLPLGRHKLTVRAEGFEPVVRQVNVINEETIWLDLPIQP